MDTTASPKYSFFGALRILLLVVVLAAAFALYIRYFHNQQSGGQLMSAELSVLDARLQNLENSTLLHEKRIKELEENAQKQANQPPVAPAAASSALPAPAGEERLAALEKQVSALKAASPQDNEKIMQSIRMLLAFHRLTDKVIGGKPFATELAAFQSAAGPDESAASPLATLAPYADSGIPTYATLLVTFDQAVQSVSAADALPPANAGFWERFKYNLAHIVTIRRIDEAQTGNSPDAIVSRAQGDLEREDIEAAASEIKSLPDALRSSFAAWLDDAQMVMDAPSLMDQMEEQVVQKAFHVQPQPLAPAAPVSTEPAPMPLPKN